MLHRFILKVKKFQLPTPKRCNTVDKNILGDHHALMSNRVKVVEPRFKTANVTFLFFESRIANG